MSDRIAAGTRVRYVNRKGTAMTGEVVEILPAEMFGEPLAVVVWLDGPGKGLDQRKKLTDLSPINA